MSDEIPDEEFRAAGFTGAARNYPLSEQAQRWLAGFNGVPFEKMPRAWKYAPNAYMKDYMEKISAEQEP